MSLAVINSTKNVNIPHGVSAWFQKDFSGTFKELGDLTVDGVTLAPEFTDFESYRQGTRSIRKKILTNRAASVTATLNEPSIVNFQRMLYGGDIQSSQSKSALDGTHLTVQEDTTGTYVDLGAAEGNVDLADITVIDAFIETDVLEAIPYTIGNATPDSDGKVYLTGAIAGTTVYVKYSIANTGLFSSEIFGSSDATIEGACQFQARNQNGGILQIWDLASVQLAPNGDISYPLDSVQQLPILLTLQERGGSFGTIYMK